VEVWVGFRPEVPECSVWRNLPVSMYISRHERDPDVEVADPIVQPAANRILQLPDAAFRV
jgi:hypothetical protein